jgi:hypothetical protein
MGTEIMAPVIHFVTRFTRPQNVLEAGAGYTTASLAKALADNKRDFDEDFELLRKKTEPYIADIESIVQSDPASMVVHRDPKLAPIGLRDLYGEKASVLARRRFECLWKSRRGSVRAIICDPTIRNFSASTSSAVPTVQHRAFPT